jgi:hypothetical protein
MIVFPAMPSEIPTFAKIFFEGSAEVGADLDETQ